MGVQVHENYDKNKPNNKGILTVRTDVMKERFLALYSITANVTLTSTILGINPRNVYSWRKTDEEFNTKWKEADQTALAVLESEATRRAVYGTEKPIYQNGKLVGHVKEYSDTLMIVLLKARAPEKYKDRTQLEHGGVNGEPMKVVHVNSNIPLANNEDQVLLNEAKEIRKMQEKQMGETEDIEYTELITDTQGKAKIDERSEPDFPEEGIITDEDLLGE